MYEGLLDDLVRLLLSEIVRVKGLIKYYDSISSDGGRLGASILNDLVNEATLAISDRNVELMQKYYCLLLDLE